MKKPAILLTGIFLISLCLTAISQTTAVDLLAAYKGEMTASAKYTAFADKAAKEGYTQVAILFRAIAKSESIHAANHKTVLERMGQKVDPFKPQFEVKTTKENLDDAIKGETTEVMTMYPEYITVAKNEKQMDAVKSMRWAMETEKRHITYLQNALYALNGNTLASLPKFYWVCPKCGNTYDVAVPESLCSFCSTASSRFIKIV
jgi:rubrerythrin